MAEPCEHEEEERSFWDDLWDIFVACLTVLLSILLVAFFLGLIIALLADLLAAIIGDTLAKILAALLFMSFYAWNFIRKGLSFIWRLKDILERWQRATGGVK
ncbi:MAG: hypothetical protein ACFFCW_00545 [Candidatus Hodarchaeota archaeon]